MCFRGWCVSHSQVSSRRMGGTASVHMVVVNGQNAETRLVAFPPRLLLGAMIGAQIENQLRMRSEEGLLTQVKERLPL